MALSRSSHLSINLLIFIFYVCINSHTVHSENSLIKSVCRATSIPVTCKNILQPVTCKSILTPHGNRSTTIRALGNILMGMIEKRSQAVVNRVNKRLQGTEQLKVISTLAKCRAQYDYIYHKMKATQAAWNQENGNAFDIGLNTAKLIKNAVRICRRACIGPRYANLSKDNLHADQYACTLEAICQFRT